MDEIDLAYLAGFIDGEGTITLSLLSNPKAFRTPELSVTSTDYYLLDSFVKRFGGSIQTKAPHKEHWKTGYAYRLKGDAAIAAIAALFPYLRHHVKRARATMILDHYKRLTKRNGKYSPEERRLKERFEDMFFALSSRGGDAWVLPPE